MEKILSRITIDQSISSCPQRRQLELAIGCGHHVLPIISLWKSGKILTPKEQINRAIFQSRQILQGLTRLPIAPDDYVNAAWNAGIAIKSAELAAYHYVHANNVELVRSVEECVKASDRAIECLPKNKHTRIRRRYIFFKEKFFRTSMIYSKEGDHRGNLDETCR